MHFSPKIILIVMQLTCFSLLSCTTGLRGKADDYFGITEHEGKGKLWFVKSKGMTWKSRYAGPSRSVWLTHHSKGYADVCGQAGSKENSTGRGEALQRPARNVHQQSYMHDLRRLVSVAELFCITNPNNMCCISVISLIHICFRIKLDASTVTLTWMRCCACLGLQGSKNFYAICGQFTFLVMNWYFCQLQVQWYLS